MRLNIHIVFMKNYEKIIKTNKSYDIFELYH